MNQMPSRKASVRTISLQKRITYRNTTMLTLQIEIPNLIPGNPRQTESINKYYLGQGREFNRYTSKTLYRGAVEEYLGSIENGFPFRPYEAVMHYEVTMNAHCTFSTFTDAYEFTGGAHGTTHRTSANWDLKSSRKLSLDDLFPAGADAEPKLLAQIVRIAETQAQENPYLFFDNYRELIISAFNPDNFFLTPGGISVYYQQIEIAPYSSGIIVFPVSYESLGIIPPNCQFKQPEIQPMPR